MPTKAALEFSDVCSTASLTLNEQCMWASLRSMQMATAWMAAISLVGFFGSRSAMAAPAVEDLVYCLDAAQHFVAVLCQLCRVRRNAINSLVAKTVGLGTSICAARTNCRLEGGGRGSHLIVTTKLVHLMCALPFP